MVKTAAAPTASIPAAPFREAVRFAAAALPGKTPLDILYNVRLVVGPEGGRVSATDNTLAASAGFPVDHVPVRIDTLVPGKMLASLLGDADDEAVRFEVDGGRLVLRFGTGKFSLPMADPTPFPVIGDRKDIPVAFTVDAEELSRGMERTAFCVDLDSKNYAMGAVLLDIQPDGVSAVSTDSKRLSVQPLAGADLEVTEEVRALVPKKAAVAISGGADGRVEVRVDKNSIAVVCGDRVIVSRQVEGRFPRYRQVIPHETPHAVDVAASPLRDAVVRASRFLEDGEVGVDFDMADGELSVKVAGKTAGECEVRLPVEFDGTYGVTLNGRCVADFLGKTPAGAPVSFGFSDAESQTKWTCGEWVYVLMPLTRETNR